MTYLPPLRQLLAEHGFSLTLPGTMTIEDIEDNPQAHEGVVRMIYTMSKYNPPRWKDQSWPKQNPSSSDTSTETPSLDGQV